MNPKRNYFGAYGYDEGFGDDRQLPRTQKKLELAALLGASTLLPPEKERLLTMNRYVQHLKLRVIESYRQIYAFHCPKARSGKFLES